MAGQCPRSGLLIMVQENKGIDIVPEADCELSISRSAAFEAVEAVFASMARGDAYNFPVIREAIGHADALYGFKSGFDRAGLALGLKSGGYWPGNMAKGLTNHQSTVFLFNPDTGQLKALVGGNYLTAVRTAAASAVSIAHLARKDAKVLGMVGAGHRGDFSYEPLRSNVTLSEWLRGMPTLTCYQRLKRLPKTSACLFSCLAAGTCRTGGRDHQHHLRA